MTACRQFIRSFIGACATSFDRLRSTSLTKSHHCRRHIIARSAHRVLGHIALPCLRHACISRRSRQFIRSFIGACATSFDRLRSTSLTKSHHCRRHIIARSAYISPQREQQHIALFACTARKAISPKSPFFRPYLTVFPDRNSEYTLFCLKKPASVLPRRHFCPSAPVLRRFDQETGSSFWCCCRFCIFDRFLLLFLLVSDILYMKIKTAALCTASFYALGFLFKNREYLFEEVSPYAIQNE